MTTDSGWEDDHTLNVDNHDNAFVDIEPMGCHEHGYCNLYRARRHGKWHVLKVLKPEYRDTPACQAMLHKEFDIGFHLSHPGIAATLGLEQIDGLGECIIEEWVDGVTLDQYINNHKLTAAAAKSIVSQLCGVLSYIHARQIIHRDLKPSNVLVTADGDRVKVIDFGVSDTASHAILKGPAGTRDYAAPEVLSGDKADSRADLYSLGIIIDLMNNRLPHVERRLDKIAKLCTASNRDQRPATANEVRSMLQGKSKGKWYALVAIVIVAIVAGVFLWPTPRKTHETSPEAVKTETTAHDTISVEHHDMTPVKVEIQESDKPQISDKPQLPQQEQTDNQEPTYKMAPNMRQLFLAKSAQIGYREAAKCHERLMDAYRLNGQESFDQTQNGYVKGCIETEVINYILGWFPMDDPMCKPFREYLCSPEGLKLLRKGRQTAFDAAQKALKTDFPEVDVQPFIDDTPGWEK